MKRASGILYVFLQTDLPTLGKHSVVLVITTGMNMRAFVQHDCDGRCLCHPKP